MTSYGIFEVPLSIYQYIKCENITELTACVGHIHYIYTVIFCRYFRGKVVCLPVTYQNLFQSLTTFFHKQLDLFHLDCETNECFTTDPMAMFSSANKIRTYVVQPKSHPMKKHGVAF